MNYICKNCSYETRLFSDMTRHHNRKNKCKKNLIGFNNSYNYEEIIKTSLIPHTNGKQYYDNNSLKNKNQNILSKNKFFEILISIDKNKLKICPLCNKSFNKIIDLKHHLILYCVSIDLDLDENKNNTINGNDQINEDQIKEDQIKEDQIKEDQIKGDQIKGDQIKGDQIKGDQIKGDQIKGDQIINNNTNTTNIINNNNNSNIILIPISFNNEWDQSHISYCEKLALLLSDYKFTKTLESILKNKSNQNVLINLNENEALVLNEDKDEIQKLKLMNADSICNKSIEKLHTLLVNFVKDIKNENIYNVNEKILDNEKYNVDVKYYNYRNNTKNEKEIINNTIKYIFNKVRDETLKNFNDITDITDKNI